MAYRFPCRFVHIALRSDITLINPVSCDCWKPVAASYPNNSTKTLALLGSKNYIVFVCFWLIIVRVSGQEMSGGLQPVFYVILVFGFKSVSRGEKELEERMVDVGAW